MRAGRAWHTSRRASPRILPARKSRIDCADTLIVQGPTMLFTLFCCFSTGLVVYCVLKRVHRKSIEIAVSLAVRDVEKEYEGRNHAMIAQLNAKEGELTKARNLVKLHESVPTMSRPTTSTASRRPGAAGATDRLRRLRSCPSASSSRIRSTCSRCRGRSPTLLTTRCWRPPTSSRSSRPGARPRCRSAATTRGQGAGRPNSAAPFSQAIRRATAGGRSPSQRRACAISAS